MSSDPIMADTPTLLTSLARDIREARRMIRPPFAVEAHGTPQPPITPADRANADAWLGQAQKAVTELQRRAALNATKGTGQ